MGKLSDDTLSAQPFSDVNIQRAVKLQVAAFDIVFLIMPE